MTCSPFAYACVFVVFIYRNGRKMTLLLHFPNAFASQSWATLGPGDSVWVFHVVGDVPGACWSLNLKLSLN